MKILVLATDAYGGTGGIAQYSRDIIAAFATYPATSQLTVIPRIIAREPEPLPPRVVHVTSAAGSKLRFAATCLRVAARERFDWIVCAHLNLLPVAAAAAAVSGARILLLTYGIEVWSRRGFVYQQLLRRVSGVISISDITLQKMQAWAQFQRSQLFLIPNAIDLARYTPGPKSSTLISRLGLSQKRVLLTVGRMDAAEQAKGFDQILEVMPALLREFPDLVYVIVGDGSDRPRLEAKAKALGLNNVRFTGYVSESEKLDYYRASDVFAMPSSLEGFGYVFLEALAIGVPVVASKVDGSREAVRNGAWGILVDPGKPEEIIGAIRKQLVSPFVPDRSELEYFSSAKFTERCHQALALMEQRAAASDESVTTARQTHEALEK